MRHEEDGTRILDSAHFKWQGPVENTVGVQGEEYGKNQLISNFCVAVPTNEGRCTQCHTGYGYKDADYDFNNPENVDCLVCHDQSGTYKKGKPTAGMPDPGVDLQKVAPSAYDGANLFTLLTSGEGVARVLNTRVLFLILPKQQKPGLLAIFCLPISSNLCLRLSDFLQMLSPRLQPAPLTPVHPTAGRNTRSCSQVPVPVPAKG